MPTSIGSWSEPERDQILPVDDASIDATLIVAGWQYLQQPEPIAAELLRITRPRGQVIGVNECSSPGSPSLDRW